MYLRLKRLLCEKNYRVVLFMFIHWMQAIRLKTMSASIAPIMLSQVLAYKISQQFEWLLAGVIMLCAIFLQISVNLANDYFDGKAGIDNEQRLGPKRALQSGLISAAKMKVAIVLCLVVSVFSGLYLITVGGFYYFLLGLLCIGGVLGYSGGPKPLASHALGEVSVLLFFGPIAVMGGFYLQIVDQHLTAQQFQQVLSYAVQMGLWAAAIMLVNNLRDIASDALAKKTTLAVLLGPHKSRILYTAILLSVLVLAYLNAQALVVLTLGTLVSLALIWLIYKREKQALNLQLAQSAAGMLFWSLLCIVWL
jgi:1,4-dihydroxy-2-naphthoate octaprenyltransferase